MHTVLLNNTARPAADNMLFYNPSSEITWQSAIMHYAFIRTKIHSCYAMPLANCENKNHVKPRQSIVHAPTFGHLASLFVASKLFSPIFSLQKWNHNDNVRALRHIMESQIIKNTIKPSRMPQKLILKHNCTNLPDTNHTTRQVTEPKPRQSNPSSTTSTILSHYSLQQACMWHSMNNKFISDT